MDVCFMVDLVHLLKNEMFYIFSINKYNSLPPWERVNPERSIKVLRVGQEYKSIPELEQLKRNSVTDK
ncbi:hypothetical protein LSH36_2200g00002 [Paralvinella palmiformis]|uniref:Uncharacterized protein n=1 Tax=Paralvinella palmiformis TaxID=53620 RepID=A0AAD9IQM3_9ANNE|nr:hypothetical protein LSH36_2200g00002 [Paralvinella palmiformis]